MTFTFQDSPYTFTRPAGDTLVWELNSLNPYSPRVSWTVAGAVIDGLTGPLTNTVVVTSAAPEAEPADNLASVTTAATYTPTVRLTAVHFDAVQGGDEAVRIANLGNAPAEIGGWKLTDGESVVVLPSNVTLAAGESVWLAKDAADFRMQFGYAPDFEKDGSDPTVPDLGGGLSLIHI